MPSIGTIIRKAEDNYLRGHTQISKHVSFSMHETLERIDAYINSKHITGETDDLDRDKPFFNISVAAANIWFRATDIDCKDIKVRGTKQADWIDSFLATIHLQEWMRREAFGQFLNEWGRVLSRYGSAVVKIVENSSGLHISVTPWNRIICDPVDFDANEKIEILELTEAELRKRVVTMGYDKGQVDALVAALEARETLDKKKKDNLNAYIKLYEIHGELSKWHLTGKESDKDTYVQQMRVMSYVSTKKGRQTDYEDFTLVKGEEAVEPNMITHLIKEDGRTLAIGAIEHLFEPQWMQNHTAKAIKDTLDIASMLLFQTADSNFVGRNVLTDMETGSILVHSMTTQGITKIDNSKTDIVSMQNYAMQWKSLGNEITGISEAMLGAQPKSGTAWRQTQALLQENYSLFELMGENKGLYVTQMLRERIIPYIKRKMLKNTDEIATSLEQNDIPRVDSIYIKNQAVHHYNNYAKDEVLNNRIPAPFDQATAEAPIKESLRRQGNQRFFKPDEIGEKTWAVQFKDLEWELEIDITGEEFNTQEALATLQTVLQVVMTPGYAQNPQAQAIVARALELTSVMSPIQFNSLPPPTPAPAQPGQGDQSSPTVDALPTNQPALTQ